MPPANLIHAASACPTEDACIVHCVSVRGFAESPFAASLDRRHLHQLQEWMNNNAWGTKWDTAGHVAYTRVGGTLVAHLIMKRAWRYPAWYDSGFESEDNWVKTAFEEFAETCGSRNPDQPWHSPPLANRADGLLWSDVEPLIADALPQMRTDWIIHAGPAACPLTALVITEDAGLVELVRQAAGDDFQFIHAAATISEVFHVISRQRVDLVVLDYPMRNPVHPARVQGGPIRSEANLARVIRRNQPGIEMIVVSDRDFETAPWMSCLVRVNTFLRKPMAAEQLKEQIERLLSSTETRDWYLTI